MSGNWRKGWEWPWTPGETYPIERTRAGLTRLADRLESRKVWAWCASVGLSTEKSKAGLWRRI